ncbi:FtsX-like permease family protein [Peptostreptococcus stomatis]|uniref:FtsX-like permease family protein n=1 Tax=Peptostreptococcus stomatis TaxID=341694 RepID=UPI00030486C9|nr:FtsX-like permease family protein [Peptostreptococcus stomatis]
MNYKNKFALKNMQKNKLSLIVFSLLLVFIFFYNIFTYSLLDIQKKDVIRYRGNANIILNNISKKDIEKISSYSEVKKSYYEDLNSIVRYKNKYIQINNTDNNILDLYESSIIKGKYPSSSNEIIVEKWIYDMFELKLNHTYEFNSINNIKKEYKIVGVADNIFANKIRGNFLAYTNLNNRYSNKNNTLYLNVENKNIEKTIINLKSKLGIDEKNIKLNYELNDLDYKYNNFTKDDLSVFLLFIFISSILGIGMLNINFNRSISVYEKLNLLGIKKKDLFFLILREKVYVFFVSLVFGFFIALIIFMLFKENLFIFNQELLGKSIDNIPFNKKMLIYPVGLVLIALIMAVIEYTKVKISLNKYSKEKTRKIKYIVKNIRKDNFLRYIMCRFAENNLNMCISFITLQVLGALILISQLSYGNLMQYHDTKLVTEYQNGHNYDILIEPVDINSEGISDEDLKLVENLKNKSNKKVIAYSLASCQKMGRIEMNNFKLGKVNIDKLNNNYKNSIKGAVFKENNNYFIKSSIYAYNITPIKNNSESILYLPDGFDFVNMNKKIPFLYSPDDKYSADFIYGKKSKLKVQNVKINRMTDKLPYNGFYYTKDDVPQIITSAENYKKLFGEIRYSFVNLKINKGENSKQVVQDLNYILKKYNINIIDKSEEINLLMKSSNLHNSINTIIAIILYMIFIFMSIHIFNKAYNKFLEDLRVVRYIGISKKEFFSTINNSIFILLGISIGLIIFFSLILEFAIYSYFKMKGFYVSVFNFNYSILAVTIFINFVIVNLVYIIKNIYFNSDYDGYTIID